MQIDLSTVVLTIINFGILVVVLNVLLFKLSLNTWLTSGAWTGLQAVHSQLNSWGLAQSWKRIKTSCAPSSWWAGSRLQRAADAARLHKTFEMDLHNRRTDGSRDERRAAAYEAELSVNCQGNRWWVTE